MNNPVIKVSICIVVGLIAISLGYQARQSNYQNQAESNGNINLTIQRVAVEEVSIPNKSTDLYNLKIDSATKTIPVVKSFQKPKPPIIETKTATTEPPIQATKSASVIPAPQSKPGVYGVPGPVIATIFGPRTVKETIESSWDIVVSSPDPTTRKLHYSVDWGDTSVYYSEAGAFNSSTGSVTHTYFTLGTYIATFSVFDQDGGSASQSFAISVEPSNLSEPIILSIFPDNGPVGTMVTLIGTGFTPTNNTIHIEGAALVNYSASADGKIIFTVPVHIASYCAPGNVRCEQYMWPIGPGKYQLWVENENGQSPNIQFTVTRQLPRL